MYVGLVTGSIRLKTALVKSCLVRQKHPGSIHCSSETHLFKTHAVNILPLVTEEGPVHLMRYLQGVNTYNLHEYWVDSDIKPVDNEFDSALAYT